MQKTIGVCGVLLAIAECSLAGGCGASSDLAETLGSSCAEIGGCDAGAASSASGFTCADAGASCVFADNPCRIGAVSCAGAVSVCTPMGTVANGMSCGANQICEEGVCVVCLLGAACTPLNPCHVGATSCGSGAPECVDTLANLANGAACGGGDVCEDGLCTDAGSDEGGSCEAGVSCVPSNPCHSGVTSCSGGNPACMDTGNEVPNGTTCGTNQYCSGGVCSACDAGASCVLSYEPCYSGVVQCIDGNSECEYASELPNGTPCGTDEVCDYGQCSSPLAVSPEEAPTSTVLAFDGALATVTDLVTTDTTATLSATIAWGDSSAPSSGTITGAAGSFTVSASHTYSVFGSYTVTVTVTQLQEGGLTGATASGTVTVTVGITEFSVTGAGASIVTGPDGNLWFTLPNANELGRITPGGAIAEFVVPTASSDPTTIAAGPDGNLWFTEFSGGKIGRITPEGTITEFAVPTAASDPYGIAAGPDGNLWFTEELGDNIGQITTGGLVTEFPIPIAGSYPQSIAAGSDGNLWFTEAAVSDIGRITTTGVFEEFPTLLDVEASGIAAGPDGNIWFAENEETSIGQVMTAAATAGTITEFPVGLASSMIAVGPDGNLWFSPSPYYYAAANFGMITTAGVATLFTLPFEAMGVTAGPDGNLWVTEASGIARMAP